MKKRLLTLCTAAPMIASPAFAQREVNASNANPFDKMTAANALSAPDRAPDSDEDTAPKIEPIAARAIYNFAGCVTETTRPGVVKLLAKDFRTKEYQEDIRKISKGHDRCAGGRLGMSGLVLAGNFAEHLLSKEFTDAALSADLGRDRSATPIEARSAQEAISLCVVMHAPQESAALFRTEVMSDKEKEAMKALAPHLSTCIQQGTQFRTNRIGLRALLALAAYRVAVTSKAGAAG